jgi:decaprenylphospho-beta-D-erythro-pentofuranosid-2-ulose 2-reductase
MRNGVGGVDSVLLIGGSSEIGVAIVDALAPRARVVLAGRASAELDAAAERLAATTPRVDRVTFDAVDLDSHAHAMAEAFAGGDIDVVVIAAGVLGDQAMFTDDPRAAIEMTRVTYTGAASAALHSAVLLRRQGHGHLVILSSVAADRPRPANFVYGSAKSGLDALGRGLSQALCDTGVDVTVVRPGFVRTRMTAGLSEAPLSTDADVVAAITARAVRRRQRIVYAPAPLKFVMGVIKVLPEPIFRRLPLS